MTTYLPVVCCNIGAQGQRQADEGTKHRGDHLEGQSVAPTLQWRAPRRKSSQVLTRRRCHQGQCLQEVTRRLPSLATLRQEVQLWLLEAQERQSGYPTRLREENEGRRQEKRQWSQRLNHFWDTPKLAHLHRKALRLLSEPNQSDRDT